MASEVLSSMEKCKPGRKRGHTGQKAGCPARAESGMVSWLLSGIQVQICVCVGRGKLFRTHLELWLALGSLKLSQKWGRRCCAPTDLSPPGRLDIFPRWSWHLSLLQHMLQGDWKQMGLDTSDPSLAGVRCWRDEKRVVCLHTQSTGISVLADSAGCAKRSAVFQANQPIAIFGSHFANTPSETKSYFGPSGLLW